MNSIGRQLTLIDTLFMYGDSVSCFTFVAFPVYFELFPFFRTN